MVFHITLLLIKEHTSHQMWQRALAHEIHYSYHVPHHPESAGFTEQQNSLLKMVITS